MLHQTKVAQPRCDTMLLGSGPLFAELHKLAQDDDLQQEQQQQPPFFGTQGQGESQQGALAGSEAAHAPLDMSQVSVQSKKAN